MYVVPRRDRHTLRGGTDTQFYKVAINWLSGGGGGWGGRLGGGRFEGGW